MHSLQLIWKNASHHSVRFVMVIAAVALCVAMFCLLTSFDRALNSSTQMTDDQRLVMVNKISYDHPIPVKYLTQVASVEGVNRVFPVTWFGGNNDAAPGLITGYATYVGAYFDSYDSRYQIAPNALIKASEVKSGMLIGADLARRMGWSLGQTVVIESRRFEQQSGSKSWEFEIVGLFEGTQPETDTNFFVSGNDYFNDARRDYKWMVGSITIEPEPGTSIQDLVIDLDNTFETAETATRTVSELEFAQSFISQLGNVSLAIKIVVAAAFCTIYLIAANMMAMTIRQRRAHIGVLKALGFTSGRIVGLIVSESVLIFVFGAIVGIVLGAILLMGVGQVLLHIVPNMHLSLETVFSVLIISSVMGLASGALPAWRSTKISVQQALTRK